MHVQRQGNPTAWAYIYLLCIYFWTTYCTSWAEEIAEDGHELGAELLVMLRLASPSTLQTGNNLKRCSITHVIWRAECLAPVWVKFLHQINKNEHHFSFVSCISAALGSCWTCDHSCCCGSWSLRVLGQLPPGTGRCNYQDHIKGARDNSDFPGRGVTQFWSLGEVSCGAEMGSFSCSYQEHVWFVWIVSFFFVSML